MNIAISWAIGHYPALFYVLLLGIAGHVGWRANKLISRFNTAIDKTDKVESTVNLLATNHLPHIQEAIESMRDTLVEELRGLRSDFVNFLIHDRK